MPELSVTGRRVFVVQFFDHQCVRDLAWALASPPLMQPQGAECDWPDAAYFQAIYHDALPWLQSLDKDPSELEDLLARQKDRRLGRYFETLWYFWLLNQRRYEIVETNLQVIIDGETLGEMDFILYDTRERCFVHWEVAVKFYLGVGDTQQLSNWHGPGQRDRLDRKFQHLLNRQSTISTRPGVANWLAERRIQIDRCAVILKGRLYYPWRAATAPLLKTPVQSGASHLRSWWLSDKDLAQLDDTAFSCTPIINQGWLANVSTDSKLQRWSRKHLFACLSNREVRLPLQLQLTKSFFNKDKVFLVKESWEKNAA